MLNSGSCTLEIQGIPVSFKLVVDRRRRRSYRLRLVEGGLAEIIVPPEASRQGLLRALEKFLPDISDSPRSQNLGEMPSTLRLLGEEVMLRTGVADAPRRSARLKEGCLEIAADTKEAVKEALRAYGRERLQGEVLVRLRRLSPMLHREWTSVAVGRSESTWGSCSRKGALRFSMMLLSQSAEIVDYVVAHECAHLKEMNHGPAFWKELERLMPEWRNPHDLLRSSRHVVPWYLQ